MSKELNEALDDCFKRMREILMKMHLLPLNSLEEMVYKKELDEINCEITECMRQLGTDGYVEGEQ